MTTTQKQFQTGKNNESSVKGNINQNDTRTANILASKGKFNLILIL